MSMGYPAVSEPELRPGSKGSGLPNADTGTEESQLALMLAPLSVTELETDPPPGSGVASIDDRFPSAGCTGFGVAPPAIGAWVRAPETGDGDGTGTGVASNHGGS